MPYEALFQNETEQALEFRAANPRSVPQKPSTWAQMGELLAAVPKGLGQAVAQTTRNVGSLADAYGKTAAYANSSADSMMLGIKSPDHNTLKAETMDKIGETPGLDAAYTKVNDALKADPVTSTTASTILQDASRVLGKVGAYSLMGGFPAAVLGTGTDEGATGYLEMRDQGVDRKTAAQVGTVRGVASAVGVAIPGVGKTGLQTLGLVVTSGPGSFMAEQATTRAILEAAEYPDIARQYDPLDPTGLGVSMLVPGVVGAVVHRARAGAAARAAAKASEVPAESTRAATETVAPDTATTKRPELTEVLRSMPEVQDAALVAHKSHAMDAHILAEPSDLAARQSHTKAYEQAARAMDEGQPVRITDLEVNPVKATEVMRGLDERMRATEAQLAPLREMMDLADEPNPTARIRGVDDGAQLAAPASLPPGPDARPLEVPTSPNAAPAALLESLDPEVRKVVQPIADLVGLKQAAAPAPKDTPMARAQRIADSRPELQVEFDGEKTSAAQLVERVAEESATTRREASAFRAAVECFLKG